MSVHSISANDLKIKGISILDKATSDGTEAIITVRGKDKYVVLPIATYNHLRECELESALLEVKKDVKNKKYKIENIEKHITRITSV